MSVESPDTVRNHVHTVGGIQRISTCTMSDGRQRKILAAAAAGANKVLPREEVLDEDNFFMATALLAAHSSRDPDCQGACILDKDKRIVGVGRNGIVGGDDNKFSWNKNTKSTYVCHAEINAIVNSRPIDVRGCTMYVTRYPCIECAKLIIQTGIKRVIFVCKIQGDAEEYKSKYETSENLFKAVGVEVIPLMASTLRKVFHNIYETITI